MDADDKWQFRLWHMIKSGCMSQTKAWKRSIGDCHWRRLRRRMAPRQGLERAREGERERERERKLSLCWRSLPPSADLSGPSVIDKSMRIPQMKSLYRMHAFRACGLTRNVERVSYADGASRGRVEIARCWMAHTLGFPAHLSRPDLHKVQHAATPSLNLLKQTMNFG